MKISPRTHLHIRLQNLAFTLLFLAVAGLLGWLSTRYSAQFDWTADGRMTLSETSRKLLDMLPGPVKVTAYAREEKALRGRISDHVGKFSRYKPDLTLQFVNPDTQPDTVRELGISVDGELMVEYRNRSERVNDATEPNLANALQRLAH
ncbi:MAG: ABC transporter, partial [Methylococcaceae bacterium]|nr:ABC transporter [Methylococcaceae bacterium]